MKHLVVLFIVYVVTAQVGPNPPIFPNQWSANISWDCFDQEGRIYNTWSGQVFYDYDQYLMITQVYPPVINVQKCPLWNRGLLEPFTILLHKSSSYILVNNTCYEDEANGKAGVVVPDWLVTSKAIWNGTQIVRGLEKDAIPHYYNADTWWIPVPELGGSFEYWSEVNTWRPVRFGGRFTDGSGAYITYIDYASSSSIYFPSVCS
eukprot:TRINITY_DN1473_c0_g1_i1.p1 TRINITY_DN1473_c0_g1~~TRINITY_DN1473_c0_g1_i1.p1  ORF type:complete len:205 (+),score=34.66 TRINITY_DN1473_c0_g1_i1:126-740(+)